MGDANARYGAKDYVGLSRMTLNSEVISSSISEKTQISQPFMRGPAPLWAFLKTKWRQMQIQNPVRARYLLQAIHLKPSPTQILGSGRGLRRGEGGVGAVLAVEEQEAVIGDRIWGAQSTSN